MLLLNFKRSMDGMSKNNIITVVRVSLALVLWYAVVFLYRTYIDPVFEGVLSELLRNVLATMVVPYTIGLGVFFLALSGMKKTPYVCEPQMSLGFGGMLKLFVIQTGLSFPLMIAVTVITRITGHDATGITPDELFGKLGFYIVLLLIFNPVFEELLFRKFILERLGGLGFKGAVIVSAILFAVPHCISIGPAQMFYAFAIGLVWGFVTLKTGKLWPAVILHSLANVYGSFLPMIAAKTDPAMSALFVLFTMAVMVPLTVVLMVKNRRVIAG